MLTTVTVCSGVSCFESRLAQLGGLIIFSDLECITRSRRNVNLQIRNYEKKVDIPVIAPITQRKYYALNSLCFSQTHLCILVSLSSLSPFPTLHPRPAFLAKQPPFPHSLSYSGQSVHSFPSSDLDVCLSFFLF
ncbi:hypothetical protein K449DRAFT_438896 [Hypoxylon sp. EC38]|nr:hypothetical protein K449DRAFT_438896 [Hypoxylon sp. EC38]